MTNFGASIYNRHGRRQQIAFAAAVEADLTLLEAAEVAANYVERFGESEIAEVSEAAESAE